MLSPQQRIVPSAIVAHVCLLPVAISIAFATPETGNDEPPLPLGVPSTCPASFKPIHATDPSSSIRQVCAPPVAHAAWKRPPSGDVKRTARLPPVSAAPS